jgi:hypothetical protein
MTHEQMADGRWQMTQSAERKPQAASAILFGF